MSWTLDYSGTTAALTIGTPTTLATDTANGTYVFEIDVTNLALGDLLQIQINTITLSGGAQGLAWEAFFQHGQISDHKVSPPVASDQSIQVVITQLAGTGRTFAWKLLRI